ncbi:MULTISPECIES: DUF305 domain-containing protein [Amycolatopsis]|uniref:DUF305 domain-containing protein n=1 Tax=Amycolatopsis TaxID=1813 RepID=UPI0007E03366|nr:DUF305 domain-containing protein [Amycolatopsis sp. M39]OAP29175.1 hypothetical protein A4R44_00970 [Amycolatopsis sp. M39]
MRRIFFRGAVLTASLLLGACSSPEPPAPAPSSQAGHNAADVAFAQQMIPHHQQALEMAKMVPSRGSDPKVADLAGRIDRAQDPEIRQMQGWLKTWGVAATSHSMPGGHEMSGDHTMTGMMSGADLKSLEAAKGPDFDRSWLDLMIKHHQGAVEMAKTELAHGADAGAKALAQRIADAQEAEIAEMRGLLKG